MRWKAKPLTCFWLSCVVSQSSVWTNLYLIKLICLNSYPHLFYVIIRQKCTTLSCQSWVWKQLKIILWKCVCHLWTVYTGLILSVDSHSQCGYAQKLNVFVALLQIWNGTRPRVLLQNQRTSELIRCHTSTTAIQRPESPTVTLTWHVCKLEDVPLVECIYLFIYTDARLP